MAKVYLAVNCHGPDGQLIEAGYAIPDGWPDDLVTGLVDSGGAGGKSYVEGVLGRPVSTDAPEPRSPEFAFENTSPVEEG